MVPYSDVNTVTFLNYPSTHTIIAVIDRWGCGQYNDRIGYCQLVMVNNIE